MFGGNGSRNSVEIKKVKKTKMAKRPRNTNKFVEKEHAEKVFVAQVSEMVPLP